VRAQFSSQHRRSGNAKHEAVAGIGHAEARRSGLAA
jgi:hypothetical protein